ncbi:MAG: alpha/beta fold hydrolase [bacterium]|nr:alpha/beta fold hydrolase [bacterium]
MKKRYFLTLLAFFICFFSLAPVGAGTAVAGDIIFKIEDPPFPYWASKAWGWGTNTTPDRIAVQYMPDSDQTVCNVLHGVSKSSLLIDNLVMSVYEGGLKPELGSLIGKKIVLFNQPTSFELDPCLHLKSGTTYWFVWTRDKFTTIRLGVGYGSKIRWSNSSPNTEFWIFETYGPYYWQTYSNREWDFGLEGPTTKEPVLIIPGIAGSELYNGEDLIWADLGQMFFDINDQFLTESLALDENGVPIDSQIRTGEAIEKILGGVPVVNINIFEGLRLKLIDSGYSLDQDLFYFPYDWRLDLSDTASLLNEKIEEIKAQTGYSKVNIVAHSMGGLLAKEYIRQNNEDSIDKLIFVGTPHIGAPKAGKIIFEGDNMSIPWLEGDRVKEIGEHSIAVHELLPNQTYFDEFGYYIKKLMSGSESMLNYEDTKQFLINNGSSANVFESAENLFAGGLENLDLSGVDAYNIVGCGDGTQSGYAVKNNNSIKLTRYEAGDKTVPLNSSDYIQLPDGYKFYATKGDHAELPSRPGVRELIADILTGQSLSAYDNVTSDILNCSIEGQELIWRSPVEVHIYDSEGRHTGPIDGGIEYGVPGVDYEIYGHEKFVFIPADGEYSVVALGLDNGTFDLSIRHNQDGVVTEAEIFNDVPVSPLTKVRFDTNGKDKINEIEVDENGEGSFIPIELTALLEGTEADDLTAPEIDIISPASISYERSVFLPINVDVSDDNSGVLSAVFMVGDRVLNEEVLSTAVRTYGTIVPSSSLDLFSYSLGSHSLEIIATDRAGNTSSTSLGFRVIATVQSTISDLERIYSLGWATGEVKNSLSSLLWASLPTEETTKSKGKKADGMLGTAFLNQLEMEYNKGNINQRAHDILKEDIEWLLR